MVFRFLILFLLTAPLAPASHLQLVTAQSTAEVSETQILENLRSIRDQLSKLKLEIEQKTPNTGRPDQKSMDFGGYQAAFSGYQMKIEELYRQLSSAYEQIGRVYRTNPKSPTYKSMVSVYLEAKLQYDGVSALFGTISPPEKMRTIAVVSTDKRLNQRISSAVKSNQPASSEDPKEIIAADEARFIGTFDAVEMFLLTKGDKAFYIFFGWREDSDTEAGKKNQTYHLSVLRSEFIPKENATGGQSAAQHLEKALKLNFFTLDTKGDVLAEINQFLTRIKSYSQNN